MAAPLEIATHFAARGLRTHGMCHRGPWDLPFGRVEMVPAIHGSGFPTPDGKILHFGTAAGFVLTRESRHL